MPGESIKWPAPLYRQFLLLAWGAGIFAGRYAAPGLAAFAIIALLCLWATRGRVCNRAASAPEAGFSRAARSFQNITRNQSAQTSQPVQYGGANQEAVKAPLTNQGRRFSRAAPLLLLSLLFAIGWGYGQWRAPEEKPAPPWLSEAATPSEGGELYKKGLRLRGVVREVTAQTDGRLRLILDQLRPVGLPAGGASTGGDYPAGFFAEEMPGGLVLTWYDPSTPEGRRLADLSGYLPGSPLNGKTGQPKSGLNRTATNVPALAARPVPGQQFEATLRVRRVHSLMNPGLWEQESYWADRRVWYRASGQSAKMSPEILPAAENMAGTGAARWRERLRQRVLAALPGVTVPSSGLAAASPDSRAESHMENAANAPSGGYPQTAPNAPVSVKPDAPGNEIPQPGAAVKYVAPGADFIPALLFGDKFLMSSAESELLSRSTLAHSLALSGLHLSYAAALGYALARLLFRLFPALAAYFPRRRGEALLALLPALAYTWLGGAPPSLLRSLLMLLFWALLLFLKKPAVLLDGLLWAVGLILLLDPGALFDLRLQMSALAIASIAITMPLLGALCRVVENRFAPAHGRASSAGPAFVGAAFAAPQRGGPAARSAQSRGSGRVASLSRPLCARILQSVIILLGTSLAVQLFLMPLLVRSFGLYGLAFPLNLLWLPVLGLIVMPAAFLGLAAAALNLPQVAGLCFQAASWPCARLLDLLHYLDGSGLLPAALPTSPHWLFMIGWWLLLALLPLFISRAAAWKRARKITGSGRATSPDASSGKAGSGSPARATAKLKKRLLPAPAMFALLGLLLCLAPGFIRHYETGRKVVRLRLLDVGQGQAVLLEWPGGGRLLLDGGGGNSPRFDVGRQVVAATLLDNRPARLDYLLASHPDQDHVQGLLFPLEYLDVRYYADNGAQDVRRQEQERSGNRSFARLLDLLEQRGLARNALYAGDRLALFPGKEREFGEAGALSEMENDDCIQAQGGEAAAEAGLVLEILHPPRGWTGRNDDESADPQGTQDGRPAEDRRERAFSDNNASLVARLVWQGRPLALLCGDAEREAQRHMLDSLPPGALEAPVLVLPHHGSAGASLEEFYRAVNPRVALASCGYGNQWNFPSRLVRQRLEELGVPLLSTAESGQIILEWSEGDEVRSKPDHSGPPDLIHTSGGGGAEQPILRITFGRQR